MTKMEVLIIFDYPAKISAEVAVKKVVIIFRYGQFGLHIVGKANIHACIVIGAAGPKTITSLLGASAISR